MFWKKTRAFQQTSWRTNRKERTTRSIQQTKPIFRSTANWWWRKSSSSQTHTHTHPLARTDTQTEKERKKCRDKIKNNSESFIRDFSFNLVWPLSIGNNRDIYLFPTRLGSLFHLFLLLLFLLVPIKNRSSWFIFPPGSLLISNSPFESTMKLSFYFSFTTYLSFWPVFPSIHPSLCFAFKVRIFCLLFEIAKWDEELFGRRLPSSRAWRIALISNNTTDDEDDANFQRRWIE